MANQNQDPKNHPNPKTNEPKSPDTPGAQEGVKQLPETPPTQLEGTVVGTDGKAIDPHAPAEKPAGSDLADHTLKERERRERENGPDPVKR